MALVNRLERFGVLAEKDWSDLTEASTTEKIDRVSKMADTNKKMLGIGELIFTGDELREVLGKEPLDDNQRYLDRFDGAHDEEFESKPAVVPQADPVITD